MGRGFLKKRTVKVNTLRQMLAWLREQQKDHYGWNKVSKGKRKKQKGKWRVTKNYCKDCGFHRELGTSESLEQTSDIT